MDFSAFYRLEQFYNKLNRIPIPTTFSYHPYILHFWFDYGNETQFYVLVVFYCSFVVDRKVIIVYSVYIETAHHTGGIMNL